MRKSEEQGFCSALHGPGAGSWVMQLWAGSCSGSWGMAWVMQLCSCALPGVFLAAERYRLEQKVGLARGAIQYLLSHDQQGSYNYAVNAWSDTSPLSSLHTCPGQGTATDVAEMAMLGVLQQLSGEAQGAGIRSGGAFWAFWGLLGQDCNAGGSAAVAERYLGWSVCHTGCHAVRWGWPSSNGAVTSHLGATGLAGVGEDLFAAQAQACPRPLLKR